MTPLQDPKKKKKAWAYLLLWFIMPFTAFQKLEELFTDDEDPKDLEDDPTLDHGSQATDKSQSPAQTLGTKPHDKA